MTSGGSFMTEPPDPSKSILELALNAIHDFERKKIRRPNYLLMKWEDCVTLSRMMSWHGTGDFKFLGVRVGIVDEMKESVRIEAIQTMPKKKR
jgi:hypothetical protein